MNIKEIGEKIAAMQEDIKSLLTGKTKVNAEQFEAATADFESRIGEVNTTLETLSAENVELLAAKAELEGQLETMATEHKEALESKDAEVAELAGKKAAAISASQGIKPIATKIDSNADLAPAKTLVEQYMELRGAEKVAFYQANKKALQAESRRK